MSQTNLCPRHWLKISIDTDIKNKSLMLDKNDPTKILQNLPKEYFWNMKCFALKIYTNLNRF